MYNKGTCPPAVYNLEEQTYPYLKILSLFFHFPFFEQTKRDSASGGVIGGAKKDKTEAAGSGKQLVSESIQRNREGPGAWWGSWAPKGKQRKTSSWDKENESSTFQCPAAPN